MNKDMLAESGTKAGQYFERGQTVFERDAAGQPWRVVSGVVWFDDGEGGADSFCGLACPGDVMGAETLIFGHYAMQAHALTPARIAPWLEAGAPVSARSATIESEAKDRFQRGTYSFCKAANGKWQLSSPGAKSNKK